MLIWQEEHKESIASHNFQLNITLTLSPGRKFPHLGIITELKNSEDVKFTGMSHIFSANE